MLSKRCFCRFFSIFLFFLTFYSNFKNVIYEFTPLKIYNPNFFLLRFRLNWVHPLEKHFVVVVLYFYDKRIEMLFLYLCMFLTGRYLNGGWTQKKTHPFYVLWKNPNKLKFAQLQRFKFSSARQLFSPVKLQYNSANWPIVWVKGVTLYYEL